jgi:hypothetical protein
MQPNSAIVAAFRERLKEVAGFKFVPEPLPMMNSKNAIVYYLFFASPKPVAQDIITHIFLWRQGLDRRVNRHRSRILDGRPKRTPLWRARRREHSPRRSCRCGRPHPSG